MMQEVNIEINFVILIKRVCYYYLTFDLINETQRDSPKVRPSVI